MGYVYEDGSRRAGRVLAGGERAVSRMSFEFYLEKLGGRYAFN